MMLKLQYAKTIFLVNRMATVKQLKRTIHPLILYLKESRLKMLMKLGTSLGQ